LKNGTKRRPQNAPAQATRVFEWPQAIKKGIAHDAAQTLPVMWLKHKVFG